MRRLNDPELVRAEYADESRFAARAEIWATSTGPEAQRILLEALARARPAQVLEVGCGRGELAERMARELGTRVVAVDQSERMVALARARGVDARLGDVQELPFEDASFDCVVAAWMLYHVPDLDRGLRELGRVLRPGGLLVAITNSESNMPELWGRFGDRAARIHGFSAENGAHVLQSRFARVERHDVRGTIEFPDWRAVRDYIASSVTRRELADELEPFAGPLVCSRHSAVFVAEAAA